MKRTDIKKFTALRQNLVLLQAMTLELYQQCLDISNSFESELEANKIEELNSDETEPGSPEVEPGQG